jgi:molecular chaperone GrpE
MKKNTKQKEEAKVCPLEVNKEEDLVNDIKRIQADFINFKNKTEGEKESFANYKLEGFFLELLDVVDNFELSLDNCEDKGVEMIHKQFLDILSRNGVKKIEEKEDFDANLHEAIEKVKGDENKVIEVVKEGYMFNDKIIRPTQVKVGGGK